MDESPLPCFSDAYGELSKRLPSGIVADRGSEQGVPEEYFQRLWLEQSHLLKEVKTLDGKSVQVVHPGWWNGGEGPDFHQAQLLMEGELVTGDVELHLYQSDWNQHGHQMDSRYSGVILHVVAHSSPTEGLTSTVEGGVVPVLMLEPYLEQLDEPANKLLFPEYPYDIPQSLGVCAAYSHQTGWKTLQEIIRLAGEWRMLNKARLLQERIERVGPDQALYEAVMTACGYSAFKEAFTGIARRLPYERVKELAMQDALLLESALFYVAGLLPEQLEEEVAYHTRMVDLRKSHLPGLVPMPISWRRVGVRPVNYPERRLSGMARFIHRTAREGLSRSIYTLWHQETESKHCQEAFEKLFPNALGFWAEHCSWTGKRLSKSLAPIGSSRVHSMIGNVFVPFLLANARAQKDRLQEEKVYRFYGSLKKESDNQVVKKMVSRIWGVRKSPRLTFSFQQGLLQLYQDYCGHNPSCHECALLGHLSGFLQDRED